MAHRIHTIWGGGGRLVGKMAGVWSSWPSCLCILEARNKLEVGPHYQDQHPTPTPIDSLLPARLHFLGSIASPKQCSAVGPSIRVCESQGDPSHPNHSGVSDSPTVAVVHHREAVAHVFAVPVFWGTPGRQEYRLSLALLS